jgi:hypothetical protein
MSDRPFTDAEQKMVAAADAALSDWPRRVSLVPTIKPLSAAWLPPKSPNTGQGGIWWKWSIDDPTRLTDATCGTLLPDEVPYRNHAAFCAYNASLQRHEDFMALAQAFRLTGDPRYRDALLDLLARFGAVYPTYPVSFEKDARYGGLKYYGPEVQGRHYTERVGSAWSDNSDLQGWLRAYAILREKRDVPPAQDTAFRELARDIIEFQSLPNFLYVNDKYHNSLTNYYHAFSLAGKTWGQELVVRDTLSGVRYTGGDLVQMVVNGPKGLRAFIANAFDRNGVYWELCASYTGYVFGYLDWVLQVLAGISDPPGYVPGPGVRDYYEPIECLDPARAFPDLWRAVLAQVRLCLNSGLYPPGNDSNYLNGPTVEWLELWATHLDSEEIRRWARGFRRSRGETVAGNAEPFPPRGSTLMPACGAATLRGQANRLNAHLDWHRVQDYHSHLDPLHLALAADGYLVLSDLGYHLGHPLRHIVSERTAAHNTVTVDREDCARHDRGTLHDFRLEGEVQWVDASVPDAYPQCTTYRRTVILVGDYYVLDLFRVAGGSIHDYALLSRADRSECSLSLVDHPGTLAHPDRPYTGYDQLEAEQTYPATPYQVIHQPRTGTGTRSFHVDWVQRDRPDLTLRARPLSGDGAEVMLAKAPHRDRRANMALKTDEILIVRRTGRPPLQSTFVCVLETLSGQTRPLHAARQVPVQSPDPSAVAVEVEHEDGVDLILHATGPGLHRVASRQVTFAGRLLGIRFDWSGASRILALKGRLEGTPEPAAEIPPPGARVIHVDVRQGIITLDAPLENPDRFAGRFVTVRGRVGTDESWLVQSVRGNGTKLHLDLRHARLVAFQGRVERLENPRVIVTGVNFCEPIPRGTPLRIGPVGDFSSKRAEIVCIQQSGLPLRIGGTTTNLTPRISHICLGRRVELLEDDVGKPFWASGIEIGDYVLPTDPGGIPNTQDSFPEVRFLPLT